MAQRRASARGGEGKEEGQVCPPPSRDGRDHQHLAFPLGNLVKGKSGLVRGQVEGAAHWRAHRGGDGTALHDTS